MSSPAKIYVGSCDGGKPFDLPEDLVTQTIGVIAKKGAGKTHTSSVMAEGMLLAGHQVVVIDPTGAWWGLRADASGGPGGFPVIVIGGDHADIPLEEGAGEVLARAIVEQRFSAIMDVSNFRKGQTRRFVTAFLETLYRLNRQPMHLFVDEADDICPQMVRGEEAQMVGALEDVVKRGRKKGIGCTLITQRPADLAKQVLTQVEMLVVLRLSHPRDLKAIEEWINVQADPDKADAMMRALPGLPIGSAFFWSPGWLDIFKLVQVRKRSTFDSGATPKPGQEIKTPKALAPVDVKKLGDEIASTVERAKQNDPAHLQRLILDLNEQLKRTKDVPAKPVVKRVMVLSPKDLLRLEKLCAQLAEKQEAVQKIIESARYVMATAQHAEGVRPATPINVYEGRVSAGRAISRSVAADIVSKRKEPLCVLDESAFIGQKITGGMGRMLIALAQRNGLSARQLGVRAGLSSSSGTFGTYLAKARSSGWIEGDRNRLSITHEGIRALGSYTPLPTGKALLSYWMNELGGGAARILEALAIVFPNSMTRQEASAAAGLSAGSGTFGTYLSKLRTLELIEGRGDELRASEDFFS